ncbi:MAG: hypothetical protein ACREMZ_16360 [Gemmatimonadales bacterium]
MQGELRVTDEALVSRDIIGDPHSSIVDSDSTILLPDGDQDRVLVRQRTGSFGADGRHLGSGGRLAGRRLLYRIAGGC